jgi:hypothetical protein
MRKIKIKIKYYILDFIVKKFSKNKLFERILNNEEKQAIKSINNGFLSEIGWWNSWRTREPQDANGKPLPWVTYSYIHFIEERLSKEMNIFEFGTGNSTLFYSNIVKQIDSVEHDQGWFKTMNNVLPENATILFEKLEYGGAYSKTALKTGNKYDLISIDGRDRVNSLINSVSALSENGVLVLDDSERIAYKKGIEYMQYQGFKRLDFWGISPGLFYKKCTSIFYRTSNVLNV